MSDTTNEGTIKAAPDDLDNEVLDRMVGKKQKPTTDAEVETAFKEMFADMEDTPRRIISIMYAAKRRSGETVGDAFSFCVNMVAEKILTQMERETGIAPESNSRDGKGGNIYGTSRFDSNRN